MQGYTQQMYDPYAGAAQQQQQQQQYSPATTTTGGYASYYNNTQQNYNSTDPYTGAYPQQQSHSGYDANQWQQQQQQQQTHPSYQTQQQQSSYAAGHASYESTVASDGPYAASASTAMHGNASTHQTHDAMQSCVNSGDPPPAALNATDENGLRWTWSTYPNTLRDAQQESTSIASIPLPEMIVPLACLYTPLQPMETSRLVIGDPAGTEQQCTNCGTFWSKHAYREEKFWVCPSCLRRHNLPSNYNPQHPALCYDTVEYILPSLGHTSGPSSPTFIFILDTCLAIEEMDALKASIVHCLDWLPSHCLVGLVTFGARVSVWELGASALTRCYSVRGNKQYEPAEVATMLQLADTENPVRGRFLVPLKDCEFALSTLLDELQCDSTVTPTNKRPLRTTGTAVAMAVSFLEALDDNKSTGGGKKPKGTTSSPTAKKSGRLILFTGGPCTRGPGTVVGVEKEEMMRFHRDIIEGETPYYQAAFKFYNSLQQRLSDVNACLDVFAESFDQIGTLEMRHAVNHTGGTFVCGDTFNHAMYTNTLKRYFERCDLRPHGHDAHGNPQGAEMANSVVRSAFGVGFEVHTSADTLVSGVLGPCLVDTKANKSKTHRATSPVQIGVGGTTRWCVSTMDHTVTYAFIFDTATVNKKDTETVDRNQTSRDNTKRRFVQFVTRYHTSNGESRVRVTSVTLHVAPSNPSIDPQYFSKYQAFDQTCAATVLARMVVIVLEKHPSKWDDTKRWLDTLLVRFVRRYGTFTPGSPESLRLSSCLSLFPSFIFNLRRSEYFMVLNISPDETTFKRHWLMRDPVENCVMMIQPTLHSYDIEVPMAEPVPLDSCSLRPDNILLMDAFFNIHIMWGTTIYAWIQAKYQENPDYAYFADLLNSVENDAVALLGSRYPYPRFSRTDANGSEARHIKTRMNPATTHHSTSSVYNPNGAGGMGDQADVIYTDEASIVKFMESLRQAVVALDSKGKVEGTNGQGGNRPF